MSFAGGIVSKKGAPKFQKAPCPILLFHGTADRIVNYKHFGTFRRGLWGSSYMASRLKKEASNYSIWRFNGRGHEVASFMSVMWDEEQAFLEKNVMQGIHNTVDALVDDPSLPGRKARDRTKTADLYK